MSSQVIQGVFEQEVVLKEVKSSMRILKDFIFLPWKIYKQTPQWSPTLISKEFRRLSKRTNPFFRHSDAAFFVAYRQGKPVGRIAAINNNRHEAYHHDGAGFFGFFECVDDYFVAKRLLLAAEDWCKERGKRSLLGPVNLSIHDEYGLLISGFAAQHSIFMPYNPPYYQVFLERHGYQKKKDMHAYTIDISKTKDVMATSPEKMALGNVIPDLTFQDLRRHNTRTTLQKVFQKIFNPEWQQQYGFLPLTEKEVDFRFKEYAKWIIPELVLIGDIKGTPISCMIMLPNFNEVTHRFNGPLSFLNNLLLPYYKHRIRTARCVLLIVRKHWRSYGIHIQMIQEAIRRLNHLGIKSMELGWISEDHIAIRHAIESFGLQPSKTYRLYQKIIPKEQLLSFRPAEQRVP